MARPTFYGNLESLRGIAALSVVVVHCLGAFGSTSRATGLGAIVLGHFWDAFNGRNAVVLFFVLSGFVLCESVRGEIVSGRLYCAFMVKRVFRIVPVAYAALIPAALYLLIFEHQNGAAIESAAEWFVRGLQRPAASRLIASFAFLSNQPIVVYWTLYVELLGSLLFLPLLRMSRLGGWRFQAVLQILLLSISYQYVGQAGWLYLIWLPLNPAFLAFFFCFHLGILVDRLRHDTDQMTFAAGRADMDIAMAILGAALLCYAHSAIGTWLTEMVPFAYKREAADVALEALGSCLIVYGCSGRKNRILDFALGGRTMRHLGRLSFGIYAIHIVVLKPVFALLVLHSRTAAAAPLLAPVLALLIVMPISIGLAHLLHVFVEKPGINLGRQIIRRLPWLSYGSPVERQAASRPGAVT